MKEYIFKRILMFIPMLFGITVISFSIMHLTPGSPMDESSFNPDLDPPAFSRLVKVYGLDQPIHKQYINWVLNMAKLDFGLSFKDNQPVIKKIAERLPATLLLNFSALIVIFAVSLPIGVICAVKKDSLTDRLFTIGVFIGYSVPSFALALLLMYYFGVKLGWLPISGIVSPGFESMDIIARLLDLGAHLFLPVITSALGGLAFISRYLRASVLEVISSDFIRAVRARGIDEKKILYRHVFLNALIPLVTLTGLLIPSLMGGSVVFETIFSWPGMGRLAFGSIMARDYPMIMGIGVIMAVLTLIGNLAADIGYALVDPRIRYRK